MTGTCDTFKMFSFSVMQSTFRFFSNMRFLVMFVTAVCVLFLIKHLFFLIYYGTANVIQVVFLLGLSRSSP